MPATAKTDRSLDPDKPISQRKFASLLGITPQQVNHWVNEGWMPHDGTFRDWMKALMNQFKGRASTRSNARLPTSSAAGEDDDGKLDLNQEKAALARTQRLIQEVKLSTARGEYAPIGLLADVLATASGAVVAQFDQLEGRLSKSCPNLPDTAKLALLQTIAMARNTWIQETAELIRKKLDDAVDDEGDEG